MGMRLFLFFTIFPLCSLSARETVYLPVRETAITSGIGYVSHDISPGDRVGYFQFTALKSGSISGGSHWTPRLYLPETSPDNHYRGEEFTCRIHISKKGQIQLDSIVYSGHYINKSLFLRALIMTVLQGKLNSLGPSGALLESLILGKKDNLTGENELFRDAGVSHLLALSGLHRGIITLFILLILRPILPRNILGILVMIILCAYTYLIGIKHSLIRAVFMYGFLILADFYKLKPSLLKILLLSLLIQVFIWPESVNSLSLQLSYLAMVGILFLANPLQYLLKKIIPPFLAIPLSLSLSAQLALFPLLITVFGKVQLWGIVAGILLTPLITIFIWIGLAAIPFLFLIPETSFSIAFLLNLIYALIIKIVTIFSNMKPLIMGEKATWLLFIFSLSVMLIRIILFMIKEGYFVRKSFKAKL